ncbi:cold shock domain-containing protein [Roseomonas nepalensis]|uniref:Cold shock domain-containing protein n=2 Tax=Muricoccus nepalensis TaxID=1854500 RepID=A0A502FAN3_9PROT|nr:cold shock domain-containing protein [Roseomonas nepalensis]
MSDWRRDRKSRKRGSDDDMSSDAGWAAPSYAPPERQAYSRQPSTSSDPEFGAVVKRFDAERGFGFVSLDGSSGDAFLHIRILQQAGADAVTPGTRLRVRVGGGERGPQVTEVLEVGSIEAARSREPRAALGSPTQQIGQGEEVRGTVKWYNAEKGFGFITRDDGEKDVFVHATALERSGLGPLTEGQVVTMQVVQGKRGLEASTVK